MTYQVTTVPRETNHILHLILTMISCGLWAPVWIAMAIINAATNKKITTQTYGVAPPQQFVAPPAIHDVAAPDRPA